MFFDLSSLQPVTQVFGSLFVLLLVATLVSFILSRSKPQTDYRELTQRINSWWIMMGVFALSLYMGPMVTILMFAMLSFIALKEYFSMTPTRLVDRRVLFWLISPFRCSITLFLLAGTACSLFLSRSMPSCLFLFAWYWQVKPKIICARWVISTGA